MLVPKKNRLAIYSELFKGLDFKFLLFIFLEGVLVAEKKVAKKTHATLEEVPNLHVIKLMLSLKSRGYVREQFCWQWYYWFLTDDGINYLREYLHLPGDIVPNTHKKPLTQRSRGGIPEVEGGVSSGKDVNVPADFRPNFAGEVSQAGFGRTSGGF